MPSGRILANPRRVSQAIRDACSSFALAAGFSRGLPDAATCWNHDPPDSSHKRMLLEGNRSRRLQEASDLAKPLETALQRR